MKARKDLLRLLSGTTLLAALLVAGTARSQVFTTDPSLPVLFPTGQYTNPAAHPTHGGSGFTVILTNIAYKALGPVNRLPSGPDEVETFSLLFDAVATVIPLGVSPVGAGGGMQTITHGKIGNTTGTFNTEMLSLSLSGSSPFGPFMIRESPTLPSLGQTTIIDIGGGLYRIDSFFDVFTELSIDGGATWIPDSNGAERITLGVVPEPSVAALAGMGIGALALRRRSRFFRH